MDVRRGYEQWLGAAIHPHGALMPAERDERPPSLSAEIEGRYANSFRVGHNAFEFLLDFGQSFPEGVKERIHTRIVLSPAYALDLLKLLRESIEQYEGSFGAIPED
jgi:hypothetical protein